MQNKKGQIWEEFSPLIIALIVLVILILIAFLNKEKLNSILDWLADFLRFGR